jgi:hypothetical protein
MALVCGIMALPVWVCVLAAFELHYMEVDHVMLDEDIRSVSVKPAALIVSEFARGP